MLLALLTISICTVAILSVRNRRRELQLAATGLIAPLRPSIRLLTTDDLVILDRYVCAYSPQDTAETCAICYELLCAAEKVVQLPQCLHVFHYKCLREWLVIKAVCPCCKGDVFTALGLET